MRFFTSPRALFCTLLLTAPLCRAGPLEDADANLKAGRAKGAEAAPSAESDRLYRQGIAQIDGKSGAKDYIEAAKHFRAAAELGHPKAQFNLAVLLEKGTGVKQDVAEALKWYQKAADQGDSAAQFNLGLKYFNGEGVPQNQVTAAKWMNLAAAKGHAKAQLVLGRMYNAGLGVGKNPAVAEKLIRDAAAQGLEQAKLELAKLESVKTDGATNSKTDAGLESGGLITPGLEVRASASEAPAVTSRPPATTAKSAALPTRSPSAGAAPAEIPPFLDVNRITPAQFAGAVSFAMESMRLVYGELTPEQEKKFEAKWRPLFQFCTPKVIDYFNKLNPLLGQFLQIRSALSAVASAFDEAQQAAATAVAVGSAEELVRAMDAAELARREMQTLNSAMEKVVDAIVALGDPPDAEGAARRRRKVHEDALASVLQPTGEYLRVDWPQPPPPWIEEMNSYGYGRNMYFLSAPNKDRYMILNPPGSGPGLRGFRPHFKFSTADQGGVTSHVYCEMMFEPYPDPGRLQPDAQYKHATGKSPWCALTRPGAGTVVPGTSAIEETKFAGFDAIHFVTEYCKWEGGAEGFWTRYEWYAVDFGLAKEDKWLLVIAELDVKQDAPSGRSEEFTKAATKSFPADWEAIKSICLPEQQEILDGLKFTLTNEIPKGDDKRFTAAEPLDADDVPFVRDQLASGVWQVAPEPWNDVREGSSASTLTLKQELGIGTIYTKHSWTAPPLVMHVEDSANIQITAEVWAVKKKKTGKLKPGEAAEYPYSDTIWGSDTDLTINFDTVASSGGRAFAKIEKEAGPKAAKKTVLFAPGKPRGTGYVGSVTIDCSRGSVNKDAFDDGSLSQRDEHKLVASWTYFWNWEPTAKVTYKAGAKQTAEPPSTPATPEERKAAVDEQAAKLNQIEFYRAQIAIQQTDLTALREQRAKSRPEDRAGFDRQIMWANDWIQKARDSITTLQTGNFTRTRTAADEFNLSVMASESRDIAETFDTRMRLVQHGPRVIALARPEEQDKLREFFDGQMKADRLASGDATRFKKVMAALGERVMGSLEQAQAKSELKLIDAEERLERVENVKSVAQTELMLLSMGGGWLRTGFAAIQGVSGYMEGGPGEAAKQVLRSYGRATMAASDAMDAYQKSVLDAYEAHAKDPRAGPMDEVRAGLGGAGWVLGKAVALEVGLKYGLEPLGRRLLNLPVPPTKKTMKELVREMQYLKGRAEGMDTVKLFQDKLAAVARASKAGASTADIDRLQREAEDVYKLIKTDWFAKMHINELGRNGDLTLVRQYNVYDHYAMAQLKSTFEAKQASYGFAKQEYRLFSNSSSAGKAGMDVDLGVIEPPRMILDAAGKQILNPARRQWLDSLLKPAPGGSTIGLNEFREQSQKNLEAAFKQVFGYDPTKSAGKEAFVNFTTSNHPEAYRDLAWLGQKGMKTADIANVDPAWVAQAASVTGFKIIDLPKHHPSFGYFATLQEQCRGTVKDFDTKLAPMLSRATNPTAVKHMQELRGVMDRFAKNEIGPVEANRLILEMTGGKGICEVKDQYAVMLQALTKGK